MHDSRMIASTALKKKSSLANGFKIIWTALQPSGRAIKCFQTVWTELKPLGPFQSCLHMYDCLSGLWLGGLHHLSFLSESKCYMYAHVHVYVGAFV